MSCEGDCGVVFHEAKGSKDSFSFRLRKKRFNNKDMSEQWKFAENWTERSQSLMDWRHAFKWLEKIAVRDTKFQGVIIQ